VSFELLRQIAGEAGGSQRVSLEALEQLLAHAPPTATAAGGSAANTLRGLAAGFAVACGVVGAVGGDDAGRMFAAALQTAGVDTSRLRVQETKRTGRCAVLISASRPCCMRCSAR
jgi:sugar/nucleoside kinase (ribokinase family)